MSENGTWCAPGLIELFILIFANGGLALLSCSPSGLQTQLDCLQRMCLDLGLTVNTDKSKSLVLISRKVGSLEEVKNGLLVEMFSKW